MRSPSGFDPINEPERSRARWLQVIERLVDEEELTEAEGEQLAEEFVLPSRVRSLPDRSFSRTYFTEALRDYLLNRTDILGDTYQERYNQLFRGGLRIHTTLDANMQALAEQARNELPDTPSTGIDASFDASIVSLDSTSGAIRVMVGGRGFVPNEREVNMALSPRQTGSSVKMFILAAAVQAGAQQNDVLDGTTAVCAAEPGQRGRAVHHHRRRQPRGRHAAGAHDPLDQLCVRPSVADRRAQPGGRHDLSDGGVALPLP